MERAVLHIGGPLTSDCSTEPPKGTEEGEFIDTTGTLETGLGTTDVAVNNVSGSDGTSAGGREGTSGTSSHKSSSLKELSSESAATDGNGALE